MLLPKYALVSTFGRLGLLRSLRLIFKKKVLITVLNKKV